MTSERWVEPPLPRSWRLWALIPLVAGALLFAAAQQPYLWVLAALSATVVIASAVSLALWPGEPRIIQYMAGGGVLMALAGILAIAAGAFAFLLVGLVGGAAVFLVAGRVALGHCPQVPGVVSPPVNLRTVAKVALDEALLAYFIASVRIPMGEQARALVQGIDRLEQDLERAGLLKDPSSLHPAPPAPSDALVRPQPWHQFPFERLTFESGFAKPEAVPMPPWGPGRRNQTMHAWLCRQPHSARPWLICIHGYRMGMRFVDMRLFPPATLYRALGLNVVMPILPLHGPRREGYQSGDHYLDGQAIDLLYVQCQALWDLRRTIAWIRQQEPGARIGVLGYSLGGYNAALLAGYEPGLDFVVSGIPVSDFGAALWSFVPSDLQRLFLREGVDAERYARVLRPVSPLLRPPLLDPSRLAIFAGSVDRVAPPEQSLRLGAHWGVPIDWYGGAHLTFRGEPAIDVGLHRVMEAAGWSPLTRGMPVADVGGMREGSP